jgi:hypothetical protein
MIMDQEYHVISVPVHPKTGERVVGRKVYLTGYPMPHEQCVTFASKATPRKGRSIRFEPVGAETDSFQAIVDTVAERDAKSACAVMSEASLLRDLDNDDGDLVKLVLDLVRQAQKKGATT